FWDARRCPLRNGPERSGPAGSHEDRQVRVCRPVPAVDFHRPFSLGNSALLVPWIQYPQPERTEPEPENWPFSSMFLLVFRSSPRGFSLSLRLSPRLCRDFSAAPAACKLLTPKLRTANLLHADLCRAPRGVNFVTE